MSDRLSVEAARLDALEAKLAFQEDAARQLSDALVAQQNRIDRLEARIEALMDQLSQGDDAGELPEPPPPHY
ncbi:MAG: SlyX family protein [Pseudomonadales bacterium]